MTQNDPVVVTGMGAVSPLGVGVETNWQRLLEGKSGVVRNDRFDVSAYACTIAGLVPPRERDPHGFDPRDHIDAKDIKKMDRFIQYGLAAADEALKQARWMPQGEAERARTATVIGSGVGGSPLMAEAVETILTRGRAASHPSRCPPFSPISPPAGCRSVMASPVPSVRRSRPVRQPDRLSAMACVLS